MQSRRTNKKYPNGKPVIAQHRFGVYGVVDEQLGDPDHRLGNDQLLQAAEIGGIPAEVRVGPLPQVGDDEAGVLLVLSKLGQNRQNDGHLDDHRLTDGLI